jgi:hypothetical protein
MLRERDFMYGLSKDLVTFSWLLPELFGSSRRSWLRFGPGRALAASSTSSLSISRVLDRPTPATRVPSDKAGAALRVQRLNHAT